MDWGREDECGTEIAFAAGPFGNAEAVESAFETGPLDELETEVESRTGLGQLEDDVVIDMKDEMVELEFDLSPDGGCNVGEIRQIPMLGNGEDFVHPRFVGTYEPAEFSEDNALKFVEDFVLFSNLNLSPEVHHAKIFRENSFPRTKGIRDVAKRISSSRLNSSNRSTGIFDWVDTPDNVKHTAESKRKRADTSTSHSEFVDRSSKHVKIVREVHRQEANHDQIGDASGGATSEQQLNSSVWGEVAEKIDADMCTQIAAEAMDALSCLSSSSCPLFSQELPSPYSRSLKDESHSEACLTKSPQKVYSRLRRKQRLLSPKSLGTAALSPKHLSVEGGSMMQKSPSKTFMMRLGITEILPVLLWKDLRKQRYTPSVHVPFSLHLDHDTIMRQKKILKRLGISAATTSEDATRYIADKFATRNMLEAIACGKRMVTPLWLESCAIAGNVIDESNFILRDVIKEKEMGFNFSASLASARHHPILKDEEIFVTKQVKPSKEMLSSFIEAVHGQVSERSQIPTKQDGNFFHELIISCEEDQTVCALLLKNGAKAYSLELI